jgi:hypothetical protein
LAWKWCTIFHPEPFDRDVIKYSHINDWSQVKGATTGGFYLLGRGSVAFGTDNVTAKEKGYFVVSWRIVFPSVSQGPG